MNFEFESGQAAFICKSDIADRQLNNLDACPKCQPTYKWDRKQVQQVLEHIGTHILFDPTDESEQDVKDNEDYQPKVSTDCQPPIATDQDVEDNVSTALPEEANRLDCRGPIATIQSDFTITARLTHSGHTQKMHDMAEVHACICGIPVSQEDIEGGQGWNVCSTGLQNSMSE